MSTTKDPHFTSPFPELESDNEGADHTKLTTSSILSSATTVSQSAFAAAALANAITTAPPSHIGMSAVAPATIPSSTHAESEETVLASLHRSAHDQAMEIINSYQS
ncbi:hypothetical protein GGI12_005337, partial [Dipsacomyces acuminosporus]